MSGASSPIRTILVERYPSRVAPRGALSHIAEELGVSTQRVYQIAKEMGVRVCVKQAEPLYECACGKVQRSPLLCSTCRVVEIPCVHCGRPVRRRTSEVVAALHSNAYRAEKRLPEYQGRVFCDRRCFIAWAVRTRDQRRWTARDERLRALLEGRYANRVIPWGLAGRLSVELGMHRSTFRAVARRMGWTFAARVPT